MGTFEEEKRRGLEAVYAKAAADIVVDLELVLREPPLDTRPTELARFPWLDRGWYERSTRALEGFGFRALRDIDGAALTAKGAPPSCVRVFLDDEGTSSAALYQVIPRSPGFVLKSILWVLGKWPRPKIIEFMSYAEDGQAASTSNQGEVNQFSPAPNLSRRALPLGSSVEVVWRAHERHLTSLGCRWRRFSTFEQLDAAREAQRHRQNEWRRAVGLLPEEIDRILAPHGKHGAAIRPHLERALAELYASRDAP